MLENVGRFVAVLACVLAMTHVTPASAGEVKLVSDTMDKVCRVEVTSGPDAPDTPAETFFDVHKGWSITKPEKLCYRRASTPDNCDSGMTQWNTRWKCVANAEPGIKELSLD